MYRNYLIFVQNTTETDSPFKPKEPSQAEKIYTTLRECREQVGLKKMKGIDFLSSYSPFRNFLINDVIVFRRNQNAIVFVQEER